jgi:hypothetical protein
MDMLDDAAVAVSNNNTKGGTVIDVDEEKESTDATTESLVNSVVTKGSQPQRRRSSLCRRSGCGRGQVVVVALIVAVFLGALAVVQLAKSILTRHQRQQQQQQQPIFRHSWHTVNLHFEHLSMPEYRGGSGESFDADIRYSYELISCIDPKRPEDAAFPNLVLLNELWDPDPDIQSGALLVSNQSGDSADTYQVARTNGYVKYHAISQSDAIVEYYAMNMNDFYKFIYGGSGYPQPVLDYQFRFAVQFDDENDDDSNNNGSSKGAACSIVLSFGRGATYTIRRDTVVLISSRWTDDFQKGYDSTAPPMSNVPTAAPKQVLTTRSFEMDALTEALTTRNGIAQHGIAQLLQSHASISTFITEAWMWYETEID